MTNAFAIALLKQDIQNSKQNISYRHNEVGIEALELAIKALEQARPNGKWKRISPAGIYECTNCNQVIMTSDIDCYKYCHGCGARMEVNADEESE